MKTTLGESVRLWRIRRGLTQEGLAMKADISRNYISMIERGEFANPSLQQVEKIAFALGFELEIKFIPKEEQED